MSLPRSFEVIELGLKTYPEALSLQQKYLAERLSGKIKDRLLIVEHPPVITEGRQASSADFFFAPAYYQAKGVEIHKTNRGGRLTYHGPGQLVAYFIFSLNDRKLSVPQFVENVEKVIMAVLREFQIKGATIQGMPGIFVGHKKIASLGFHIHKGVSMHGIAINVHNDLTPFSWFNPCGMPESYQITSMAQELAKPISLSQVTQSLVAMLSCYF